MTDNARFQVFHEVLPYALKKRPDVEKIRALFAKKRRGTRWSIVGGGAGLLLYFMGTDLIAILGILSTLVLFSIAALAVRRLDVSDDLIRDYVEWKTHGAVSPPTAR